MTMNRQEEVFEIARQVLSKQAREDDQKLYDSYNKHKDAVLSDFYQNVRRLIILTQDKQEKLRKRPVQYVAASYLLSSSITGTFEFQLSLLDDQYFLDSVESCVYWTPKWLFATVESDWEILLNSVRSKVIRLHQYELDAIWRSYIFEFYNGLAALFFAEHLKNAAIDGEMESLSLADEVFFTYGGYMDRFIKLDTWKREQR